MRHNLNKENELNKVFGSLWVLGVILLVCFVVFILSMSVYGLYLAFSASIILGIIAFLIEPSPLFFGLMMFFFDKNIPLDIIEYLTK